MCGLCALYQAADPTRCRPRSRLGSVGVAPGIPYEASEVATDRGRLPYGQYGGERDHRRSRAGHYPERFVIRHNGSLAYGDIDASVREPDELPIAAWH